MRQRGSLLGGGLLVVWLWAGAGCSDDTVNAPSCTKDADCPLKTLPLCDLPSGRCVAAADLGAKDGGHDAPRDLRADVPAPDVLPPDVLQADSSTPAGGACGAGKPPCASGTVCNAQDGPANGVCCELATCGACKRCNAGGQCANDDSAGNTAQECGSHAACKGTCQNGGCTFPAQGTDCGSTCNGATLTQRDTKLCDDQGACAPGTQSCAAHTKCKPGTPATCPAGCVTHGDCVANSVCDRTNAHATGLGTCVDPANVAIAGTKSELEAAINAATPKAWIKVTAGTYNGLALSVTGNKTVRIAGDGSVNLAGDGSAPVVTVTGNGEVTLQGLTLVASPLAFDGINCNATAAKVTLIESTITGAKGVGINGIVNCDVTVRRSTLSSNSGGGLNLASGTFVITNTLIESNGKTGVSSIGGVAFGTGSTVVFQHNTVVFNHSANAGGVICTGAYALEHSIIGGNDNAQSSTCNTADSNVNGTCGVSAPGYKPTAAGCKGQVAQVVGSLKLDHDNGPRFSGTPPKAALGCYEVP